MVVGGEIAGARAGQQQAVWDAWDKGSPMMGKPGICTHGGGVQLQSMRPWAVVGWLRACQGTAPCVRRSTARRASLSRAKLTVVFIDEAPGDSLLESKVNKVKRQAP